MWHHFTSTIFKSKISVPKNHLDHWPKIKNIETVPDKSIYLFSVKLRFVCTKILVTTTISLYRQLYSQITFFFVQKTTLLFWSIYQTDFNLTIYQYVNTFPGNLFIQFRSLDIKRKANSTQKYNVKLRLIQKNNKTNVMQ